MLPRTQSAPLRSLAMRGELDSETGSYRSTSTVAGTGTVAARRSLCADHIATTVTEILSQLVRCAACATNAFQRARYGPSGIRRIIRNPEHSGVARVGIHRMTATRFYCLVAICDLHVRIVVGPIGNQFRTAAAISQRIGHQCWL